MSKGSDDIVVLAVALAALAAVIAWAAITGGLSEGVNPIPLPTAPPTTVTIDE